MAGIAFLVDMFCCVYYIHDSNICLCGGGYAHNIVHSISAISVVGTI